MLDIPLGLYQIRSEYLGRSPTVLVCVTPALQWKRRYCPSGASLIFERYFLLMNVLHVDQLSRSHQSSLILTFAEAARMVLPTFIMLVLPFFILLLIGSVCRTSSVEVFQNMSTRDGGSPHSQVGDPTTRLHEASLTFTNTFWYPPPWGSLEDFSCFIFLNESTYS